MSAETAATIASRISEAGYTGLFLSGDHNRAATIWHQGAHRGQLEQIVQSSQYDDLTRILASEILYAQAPDYPPPDWADTLGYLYARALAITADTSGPLQLTGNAWGFMYHTDTLGVTDYGQLGTHLVAVGPAAVPYLSQLLANTDVIFYEGSKEATVGNSFAYRVKDAAAYFIGKITGTPVAFHKKNRDRDAEIERLKATLRGTR